jgi:hypothetical protein
MTHDGSGLLCLSLKIDCLLFFFDHAKLSSCLLVVICPLELGCALTVETLGFFLTEIEGVVTGQIVFDKSLFNARVLKIAKEESRYPWS